MARRKSRPAPTLRRHPSGRSAGEIVESILRAASLLLDRDGIDGLTTNAVARAAGVSVGSVYRYFPDKHAIVAELARRVESTAFALMSQEAPRLRDASAKEIASRAVSLSCARAFGTGTLRRALLREVPRGWTLAETRSTDATIGAVLLAFYGAREHQIRPVFLEKTVFMLQHVVEGVSEAILLVHPDALPTSTVQRELFHVAWAYLAPEGDDLARPPVDDRDLVPPPEAVEEALTARLLRESPTRTTRRAVRKPSARALATRETLLDALERVLARGTLTEIDVRSIVSEAGYAVGTLYRQFPNVQSAGAALACRLEQRACERLGSELASVDDLPALAAALVSAYLGDEAAAGLRRALLMEIPRRWTEETTTSVQRKSIERLATALEARAPMLRAGDLRLMAFVALHSVKTVGEAYDLHDPPGITRAELRAMLEELVVRYLAPPPSGSG